jgi:hypothetical protein
VHGSAEERSALRAFPEVKKEGLLLVFCEGIIEQLAQSQLMFFTGHFVLRAVSSKIPEMQSDCVYT